MRQVLVPFPSWSDSAKCLHKDDLDSTIRAAVTVLDYYHEMDEAPEDIDPGDERWDGYEVYLCAYLLELLDEWAERAGAEHELRSRADFHFECEVESGTFAMEFPDWLEGDPQKKDRALLFKRNPDYYIELFKADGTQVA